MKKIFKNKIISTAMVAMLSVSSFVGVSSLVGVTMVEANTNPKLTIISSNETIVLKPGDKLTTEAVVGKMTKCSYDGVRLAHDSNYIRVTRDQFANPAGTPIVVPVGTGFEITYELAKLYDGEEFKAYVEFVAGGSGNTYLNGNTTKQFVTLKIELVEPEIVAYKTPVKIPVGTKIDGKTALKAFEKYTDETGEKLKVNDLKIEYFYDKIWTDIPPTDVKEGDEIGVSAEYTITYGSPAKTDSYSDEGKLIVGDVDDNATDTTDTTQAPTNSGGGYYYPTYVAPTTGDPFVYVGQNATSTNVTNATSAPTNTTSTTSVKDAVITARNTTIKAGEKFDIMKNVKAKDNGGKGADLTKKVTAKGTINTQKAGSYSITYKVKGANGNTVSKSVTLYVK